jgi:hypothetical protein
MVAHKPSSQRRCHRRLDVNTSGSPRSFSRRHTNGCSTDFDAQVASIPVPAAAEDRAAALTACVRFADQLGAAPLAAAPKGQAAHGKELRSESGVENDPTTAPRAAASLNDSCRALILA